MDEQITGIQRKVFRHRDADELNISRIPSQVKKDFIAFANEGSVGDYGMDLKSLLQDHEKIKDITRILEYIDDRFNKLETMLSIKPKENKKILKTLDGKEHQIGGKDE